MANLDLALLLPSSCFNLNSFCCNFLSSTNFASNLACTVAADLGSFTFSLACDSLYFEISFSTRVILSPSSNCRIFRFLLVSSFKGTLSVRLLLENPFLDFLFPWLGSILMPVPLRSFTLMKSKSDLALSSLLLSASALLLLFLSAELVKLSRIKRV